MAVTTLAVASVAAGAYSANRQSSAAKKAAKTQGQAADAGIDEQRRQFDEIQKLLAPYVNSGNEATEAQRAFLGLAGADKQREAIKGIQEGEQFQAAAREGENAILQNASATGGLRGGNVQGALAKFRPNLLNQVIAQRFAGLESLAGRGQASAAGQAAAGQNSAAAIAGLLQEQGAAQAGAQLARGNAQAGLANGLLGAAGTIAGAYANRGVGVANPTPPPIVSPTAPAAPQYGTRGPI